MRHAAIAALIYLKCARIGRAPQPDSKKPPRFRGGLQHSAIPLLQLKVVRKAAASCRSLNLLEGIFGENDENRVISVRNYASQFQLFQQGKAVGAMK